MSSDFRVGVVLQDDSKVTVPEGAFGVLTFWRTLVFLLVKQTLLVGNMVAAGLRINFLCYPWGHGSGKKQYSLLWRRPGSVLGLAYPQRVYHLRLDFSGLCLSALCVVIYGMRRRRDWMLFKVLSHSDHFLFCLILTSSWSVIFLGKSTHFIRIQLNEFSPFEHSHITRTQI